MPAMIGSVTEASSHDEDRDGRSLTGVNGKAPGTENKRVIVGMKNELQQKWNGGLASWFTALYSVFLSL